MNPRLLCGVVLLTVGCSGNDNSDNGGDTGGTSGAANGGLGGTGATSTGAQPGGGGVSPGGTTNGGTGNVTFGNGGTAQAAGGSGVGGAANGGAPNGGTGNGGTAGAGNGGTAGAGNGGTAGAANGGTAGMGAGGAPPDTSQSVLERNKHPSRDGYFVQPALTVAAAQKMAKDTGFAPSFDGNMWASPLYIENGPAGKGAFFAVTTTNNVYALDETTGGIAWMHNIGSSPTANGPDAPCGSIHPLGIISTPVIDATARVIYVAGAIGTSSIMRHEVHALSLDDGTEKAGWPVIIDGTSGATTFSPQPQNQRSALSLVNGTLYVAYGGHVGDCGNYHGWVFGIDTKDPTKKGGWATLGRGEGIWASGGMASDGNGVFAVTGNNTAGANDHMQSDSEQVVRITGLGVLNRSNANLYFPASWRSMDSGDQDFGSASPVYISVPGATPSHFVAAASKDGHLYLLDPANLGGMGGHKVDFKVANGSNTIHTAPGSYTTAMGTYFMLGTDGGGACPAGGPSGKVVMGVRIPPGSPPKPVVAWCAASGGGVPGPIATSTDGTANPIVWYMSGSTLQGVDGDTGKSVFSGKGSDACSGVEQWTSLIAAKGRIISGADGKLCSYSPH
jgi:hypothetical protein